LLSLLSICLFSFFVTGEWLSHFRRPLFLKCRWVGPCPMGHLLVLPLGKAFRMIFQSLIFACSCFFGSVNADTLVFLLLFIKSAAFSQQRTTLGGAFHRQWLFSWPRESSALVFLCSTAQCQQQWRTSLLRRLYLFYARMRDGSVQQQQRPVA
jgi:hypothetical protein